MWEVFSKICALERKYRNFSVWPKITFKSIAESIFDDKFNNLIAVDFFIPNLIF